MGKGSNLRGLCIIPEGRYTKNCKDVGYIYEVSNITNLKDIIEYASRHNLGVLYLSNMFGLVYADDIVRRSDKPLYTMSDSDYNRWNMIVAEEVYRECVRRGVSTVSIMCKTKYTYGKLIDILEKRGIEVFTPIMGCSSRTALDRLKF